jgi:hypothetical protein
MLSLKKCGILAGVPESRARSPPPAYDIRPPESFASLDTISIARRILLVKRRKTMVRAKVLHAITQVKANTDASITLLRLSLVRAT